MSETTYRLDEETGQYVPVAAPAVDSSDPNYWSQRNAAVLRGQWDNWKQNYKPLEEYYAGLVVDPAKRTALRAESLDFVGKAADSSLQRGLTSLANRDQRYGVGLSGLEQQSRDRKMGAEAALVKAKGLTDMSGYVDQREQEMMSGGIAYARTT